MVDSAFIQKRFTIEGMYTRKFCGNVYKMAKKYFLALTSKQKSPVNSQDLKLNWQTTGRPQAITFTKKKKGYKRGFSFVPRSEDRPSAPIRSVFQHASWGGQVVDLHIVLCGRFFPAN